MCTSLNLVQFNRDLIYSIDQWPEWFFILCSARVTASPIIFHLSLPYLLGTLFLENIWHPLGYCLWIDPDDSCCHLTPCSLVSCATVTKDNDTLQGDKATERSLLLIISPVILLFFLQRFESFNIKKNSSFLTKCLNRISFYRFTLSIFYKLKKKITLQKNYENVKVLYGFNVRW